MALPSREPQQLGFDDAESYEQWKARRHLTAAAPDRPQMTVIEVNAAIEQVMAARAAEAAIKRRKAAGDAPRHRN